MSSRPLVLLSNDDGVSAPGLLSLREALLASFDVVVCAPETNQSATSHSLTLGRPLRLRCHGEGLFAVDGTPADAVYVALHAGTRVLQRRPDLCVSGLNHGLNLGIDVFYSGTVAAAREAALRGIVSIAFSADARADRARACDFARHLALEVAQGAPAGGALFNVNFPAAGDWRVRATKLGRRAYEDEVDFRVDPRNGEYLWIGGGNPVHHDAPGSDTEAYDAGEVGITPLSLDLYEPAGRDRAEAIAERVTDSRSPLDPRSRG